MYLNCIAFLLILLFYAAFTHKLHNKIDIEFDNGVPIKTTY